MRRLERRRKPLALRELRRPLRELVVAPGPIDAAPRAEILDVVTGPFERQIVTKPKT